MDKVFENIKVYDFLGIWGAGIITLIYGILSYAAILQDNIMHYFRDFQSDYSLLIIFILSVLAYLIGTLIHEIGKWVYTMVLQPDTLIALAIKGEHPHFFKRQKKMLYRDVMTYYDRILEKDGTPKHFGAMIEYLKAKNQSKITDRYHALYGLMRGLLIGIFVVFVLSGFMLLIRCSAYGICFVVADVFILLVLAIRTYRYYLGWISHTIAQYSLCKENS